MMTIDCIEKVPTLDEILEDPFSKIFKFVKKAFDCLIQASAVSKSNSNPTDKGV